MYRLFYQECGHRNTAALVGKRENKYETELQSIDLRGIHPSQSVRSFRSHDLHVHCSFCWDGDLCNRKCGHASWPTIAGKIIFLELYFQNVIK